MKAKLFFLTICFTSIVMASDIPLIAAQKELPYRLFLKGRYEEALYEYGNLENNISAAEKYFVYFWKGNCLVKLKRYDEALSQYRKVASSDFAPKDYKMKAYYNMMMLAYYKLDTRMCDERASFFIRMFPDSSFAVNAAFYRADVFFAQGNYAEAKNRFEDYLSKYPKSEKAWVASMKLRMINLLSENGLSIKSDEEKALEASAIKEKEDEMDLYNKQLLSKIEILEKVSASLNEKSTLLDEKEKHLREAEKALSEREKALKENVDKYNEAIEARQ